MKKSEVLLSSQVLLSVRTLGPIRTPSILCVNPLSLCVNYGLRFDSRCTHDFIKELHSLVRKKLVIFLDIIAVFVIVMTAITKRHLRTLFFIF